MDPISINYTSAPFPVDRPRFGRHVLPCVVDVCISELLLLDYRAERPGSSVRLLSGVRRGRSGIGWNDDAVLG